MCADIAQMMHQLELLQFIHRWQTSLEYAMFIEMTALECVQYLPPDRGPFLQAEDIDRRETPVASQVPLRQSIFR